jgi:hypothetical protein
VGVADSDQMPAALFKQGLRPPIALQDVQLKEAGSLRPEDLLQERADARARSVSPSLRCGCQPADMGSTHNRASSVGDKRGGEATRHGCRTVIGHDGYCSSSSETVAQLIYRFGRRLPGHSLPEAPGPGSHPQNGESPGIVGADSAVANSWLHA